MLGLNRNFRLAARNYLLTTMNKYLTIIFFGLLTMLAAVSCSDSYKQKYSNFKDFNNANQRNKSWFPNIITSDSYNLKNVAYLNPLCAFGTFDYSDSNFCDSLFKSSNTRIDFSVFKQKVNENMNRKPDWFLNLNKTYASEFETIQLQHFYITRKIKAKKIYFILTN
jgi:hypothetical protein